MEELAQTRLSNHETTSRMVDFMFAALDEDLSGTVSIPELCGVIFPKARSNTLEDIILYLMMRETPRENRENEEGENEGKDHRPVSEEVLKELRQLFDIYDIDRSGTLTVDELRSAMSSAFLFDGADGDEPISSTAANITTTDFERIIMSCDMNGDNLIDFEEWVEMMRHFFE